ncbi:hypothetical protein [Ruminococcus flavefaciens]|uniref:hypothetical protein n=1 Tax=Ruminococcus flavefaciens TaxID=1265 RepID=UPI0012BBABF9|nr:hypothetical protein [Ruminococcus flavefaciens]
MSRIKMQLKLLPQNSEDKLTADAINEEAFPECERNSLDDMYASDTADKIEILGIYDDNAIAGFFIVRIIRQCNTIIIGFIFKDNYKYWYYN